MIINQCGTFEEKLYKKPTQNKKYSHVIRIKNHTNLSIIIFYVLQQNFIWLLNLYAKS